MKNVNMKMKKTGRRTKILLGTIMMLLGLIGWSSPTPRLIEPVPTAHASEVNVIHVPRDYAGIQAAVNAASPGDIIQVASGVYNEKVVVSISGIRLHASSGVVVDGTGLTGVGIFVLGAAAQPVTEVEVSGFEVRNFGRGIAVQFAAQARIRGNEVHDNLIAIDLFTTQFSEVSENIVYNNDVRGIALRLGSTNNTLRANRIYENGPMMMMTMDGQGIMITGEATNDNRIVANEILRNCGYGIWLIRPPGLTPITGNLIAENRLHDNQRAGIAMGVAGQNNYILQNDARNNNLSGLPPDLTFNLFDEGTVDNIWERNLGTSNVDSQ